MAEAVAAGRHLLRAARPRLAGDLETAVEEGCRAWDQGRPEISRERLTAALALARELNYC